MSDEASRTEIDLEEAAVAALPEFCFRERGWAAEIADLTPGQEALRGRIEGLIAVAAPFLDVVLGVGERISRIAEPTDHEYYPIRSGGRVALPGEAGYEPDADLGAAAAQPDQAEISGSGPASGRGPDDPAA